MAAPAPLATPAVTVAAAIGDGTPFAAFSTYDAALKLTADQAMRAARFDAMSGCQKLRELHPQEPARTLTASNLANNHAQMMRLRMDDGATLQRPSVEQAARLQSFPTSFEFPAHLISRRQAYIAIGNAVPPEMGRHLAAAARAHVTQARQSYSELLALARQPPDAACAMVGVGEATAKGAGALALTFRVSSGEHTVPLKCVINYSQNLSTSAGAERDSLPSQARLMAVALQPEGERGSYDADGGVTAAAAVGGDVGVDAGSRKTAAQAPSKEWCGSGPLSQLQSAAVQSDTVPSVLTAVVEGALAPEAIAHAGETAHAARGEHAGAASGDVGPASDAQAVPAGGACGAVAGASSFNLSGAMPPSVPLAASAACADGYADSSVGAVAVSETARQRKALARRWAAVRVQRAYIVHRMRVKVAALEAEVTEREAREDYGPGSAVAAARMRSEFAARARLRSQVARRTLHAVCRGEVGDGIALAAGVAPASGRDSTPLFAKHVGFLSAKPASNGGVAYRSLSTVIVDTGAFIDAVDERTARRMEREGKFGTITWNAEKLTPMGHGVGGSMVMVVGTCTATICIRDEDSLREYDAATWRRFEVKFNVIKSAYPLMILGIPFLHDNDAKVYVGKDVVELGPPGSVMRIAVTSDCAPDEPGFQGDAGPAAAPRAGAGAAVHMLAEESHPFVFTAEEYVIEAGGTMGIEVELPEMLAGMNVHMHPLPDSETTLYANRRGLRLCTENGLTQIVRMDGNGRARLKVTNMSDKPCTLPPYVPVGQYKLDPEVQPHADMDVDEIVQLLRVDAGNPEDIARIKAAIKEQLFKDREERRSYFSQKRVGKGAGVPPAVLELTPEFLQSGKAPPSMPPRPTNAEQGKVQAEYVSSLLEGGQLQPSVSPFGAGVVMVRKPKGGWRMAYDYRFTNEVLVKQHYSLKSTRQCVDAVAKSDWYSSLDMLSAFWQIKVHKDSRRFTAVNFKSGKFEHSTLPMGLQCASAVFQRAMDTLLVGLQPELACSFIDDVCIHSSGSLQDHLLKVARVIDRIGGAGFTLRPEKCIIAARSIDWLGYHIGGGVIRPDDSKISQVRDAPFPVDSEDLSKWVGLLNWCSGFIPNLAHQMAPLQARMNAKSSGPPTQDELAAFAKLTRYMTQEGGPICALPDFEKPFYLYCDAANTVGCGAALVQLDGDGREQVIAYWARRWIPAESRWHSLEHECCCVVEAIKRFGSYLDGKFYVVTDAEPLVWLNSMKNPKKKYATWCMELQSYDFEIIHRPGHLHQLADTLSRLAHVLPEHRPQGLFRALREGDIRSTVNTMCTLRPEDAGLIRSLAAQDVKQQDGAARLVATLQRGTGAAYDPGSFQRKRVTATLFTDSAVFVRDVEGSLELPSALKDHKKEPLREAAARALSPLAGSLADGAAIMQGHEYCMPSPGTRHMLVPVLNNDTGERAAALARLDSEQTDGRWLDLSDPTIDIGAMPWAYPADAAMVRRIAALVRSWQAGDHGREHHFALTGACEAALAASMAPVRPAASDAKHDHDHGEGVTPCSLVGTVARAGARPGGVDTAHLVRMAEQVMARGVLSDGRQMPTAPLVTRAECVEALGRVQTEIAAMQAGDAAADTGEAFDVAFDLAAGYSIPMSVDFEYAMAPSRRVIGIAYAQVAVGSLILVFDARECPELLGECELDGVPTLRHWLESDAVCKVMQSCGSDVKLLGEIGIRMSCVFDTAVADNVLRGKTQSRKLDTLVNEYVGEGLLPLKAELTAAVQATLWSKRPLPVYGLVYAWQDVAQCNNLYRTQRDALARRGLLEVARELSRHVAQRDNALAPKGIHRIGMIITRGEAVLVRQQAEVTGADDAERARGQVFWSLPRAKVEPTLCHNDPATLRNCIISALAPAGANAAVRQFVSRLRIAVSKRRWVLGECYLDIECGVDSAQQGELPPGLVAQPLRWFTGSGSLRTLDARDGQALQRTIFLRLVAAGPATVLTCQSSVADATLGRAADDALRGVYAVMRAVEKRSAYDPPEPVHITGALNPLRSLHAMYQALPPEGGAGREAVKPEPISEVDISTPAVHWRLVVDCDGDGDVTTSKIPERKKICAGVMQASKLLLVRVCGGRYEVYCWRRHYGHTLDTPGGGGNVGDPSAWHTLRREVEEELHDDGEIVNLAATAELGAALTVEHPRTGVEHTVHVYPVMTGCAYQPQRAGDGLREGYRDRYRLLSEFAAGCVWGKGAIAAVLGWISPLAARVNERARLATESKVLNARARAIQVAWLMHRVGEQTDSSSARLRNALMVITPAYTVPADLARDVCVYYPADGVEGPRGEWGSARGLALCQNVQAEMPKIVAVCTGRVVPSRTKMTAAQRRFAMKMGSTSFTLKAHPLHNAWALANEPKEGEEANCEVQMVDVSFPLSVLLGETKLKSVSARQAAQRAMDRLHSDEGGRSIRLCVAVLVQVRPVGPTGELTLHYGEDFDRDYVCGTAVKTSRSIMEQEVWLFLESIGLHRAQAARSLLLCGAPLDRDAHTYAVMARDKAPKLPVITMANCASLRGATAIPEMGRSGAVDAQSEGGKAEVGDVPATGELGGSRRAVEPWLVAMVDEAGTSAEHSLRQGSGEGAGRSSGSSGGNPRKRPKQGAEADGPLPKDKDWLRIRDALRVGTPESAGLWVEQFMSKPQPGREFKAREVGLLGMGPHSFTARLTLKVCKMIMNRLGYGNQTWKWLAHTEGFDVTAMCKGEREATSGSDFEVLGAVVGFYHADSHTYVSHLTATKASVEGAGIAGFLQGCQTRWLRERVDYSDALAARWAAQGENPLQAIALAAPAMVNRNRGFYLRDGWQVGDRAVELALHVDENRADLQLQLAQRMQGDHTLLTPQHFYLPPPDTADDTNASAHDGDDAGGEDDGEGDGGDPGGGGDGGGGAGGDVMFDLNDDSDSEDGAETNGNGVIGGDGSSVSPYLIAAVQKLRNRPERPTVDTECQYVAVVVHDGQRAVYLHTPSLLPMGGLNPSTAAVVGRTTEVFKGIYAAQLAVRLKVGLIWERPEFGVSKRDFNLRGWTERKGEYTAWYELKVQGSLPKLQSTLDVLHADRQATPKASNEISGVRLMKPSAVASSVPDAEVIARIVAGDAKLGKLRHDGLVVPRTMSAADMAREDPAYQLDYEPAFESRAFVDVPRSINVFHDGLRQAEDAEPTLRSTRQGIAKAMRAQAWRVQANLEDGDDEVGMSTEEQEDGSAGREAEYNRPAHHPAAKDPAAFIEHLLPGGLPGPVLDRLIAEQKEDEFCQRTIRGLQRLAEHEECTSFSKAARGGSLAAPAADPLAQAAADLLAEVDAAVGGADVGSGGGGDAAQKAYFGRHGSRLAPPPMAVHMTSGTELGSLTAPAADPLAQAAADLLAEIDAAGGGGDAGNDGEGDAAQETRRGRQGSRLAPPPVARRRASGSEQSSLTAPAAGPLAQMVAVRPAEVAAKDAPPAGRAEPLTQKKLAQLQALSSEFMVADDGVLYHIGTDRLGREHLEYVVPASQTEVLIRAAHDGMLHLGRERTIDALRASRLWWATLRSDVRRFCRKCPTCAFNKVGPRHGAMHIPPNGSKPWEVACVDVVHLETTSSGNAEAVIFSDRFGRGIRAFAVPKTIDSRMFINIVLFALIPDVGMPRTMISDRGSILISKLVRDFYQAVGIEMVAADAHMHTAVGLCERFNTSLREMARAAYFDSKCEWDLYLPHLVMFYNATIQASTGFSPYFIEHGREASLPWGPHRQPPMASSVDEFVGRHLVGLHMAWEVCQAQVDQVEKARKAAHDSKYRTNVQFGRGDRVLLLQPGRVSKMELPYVGPYRIESGPDERDRYSLRDLYGRHTEFHVSKLKLWPAGDDLDDSYYLVERIVDRREISNGTVQYRVRWKGYSAKHDTWEPLEHLNIGARAEALTFSTGRDENDGAGSNKEGHGESSSVNAGGEKPKKPKATQPPLAVAPPAAAVDSSAERKERRERRALEKEQRVAAQAATSPDEMSVAAPDAARAGNETGRGALCSLRQLQ